MTSQPAFARQKGRSTSSAAMAVLLVLSGFCGISYEILYARLLGNLIGDQMVVSASVLMTFLFGIGCGTRWAYRFWRHLWQIEAGIGICGLVFAFGTDWLETALYATWPILGQGLFPSILLCLVVLSVPAFLIGCSLPLFAGYLSRVCAGRVFAKAYMWYNLGAGLTCLLIEFWLLHRFGLRGTLFTVASVNLLVAGLLRLSFAQLRDDIPSGQARVAVSRNDACAVVLTGIASAIFQLMMIKSAECLVGPFHETFSLVLAVVLFGIAIGSLFTDKLQLGFGAVVVLNVLGLTWFLGGFEAVSYFYARHYTEWVATPLGAAGLKFLTVALLTAVPAATFGATIPALLKVQKHVARESGELLFLSSMANAFGFLMMVCVLHRTFSYGVMTLLVMGLSALGLVVKYRFRPVAAGVAFSLLAAGIAVYQTRWDENLLYLGHTAFHSERDLEEARDALDRPEMYRGSQDVFAINWVDGKPYFFINGYTSIPLNSPSEKLVGAFSSVFAPRSDRALVLGVGSGATAGTVGQIFQQTVAVEINPVVLEHLDRMAEYNFDIEHNEHVRIVHDDGIHFVKSDTSHYSLIVNTVTTPLYFSSSKLYTQDFLGQVRQRLSKDGVYVTWVDSRIGDEGMNITLKTIAQVFDHCAIGCIKSSYYLLLCSPTPIRAHQPQAVTQDPVLQDYFLTQHDLNPAWLAYGLLSDDVLTLRDDSDVRVNTLDYPALEFTMARLSKRGIPEFKKRLRHAMRLETVRHALEPAVTWNPFHLLKHVTELLGNAAITDRWRDVIRRESSDFASGMHNAELDFSQALAETADTANARHKYGYRLLRAGQYDAAAQQFRLALARNPRRNNSHFNLGACYERLQELNQAVTEYRMEATVDPNDDDVPYRIARVLIKLERFQEALPVLDEAIRIHDDAENQFLRGRVLEALGRRLEALTAYQTAMKRDPGSLQADEAQRHLQALVGS